MVDTTPGCYAPTLSTFESASQDAADEVPPQEQEE